MELGPSWLLFRLTPSFQLSCACRRASGPNGQALTGFGVADAINPFSLGTPELHELLSESTTVLFEMAERRERPGLCTHVPHLPLAGAGGVGAAQERQRRRGDGSRSCCHWEVWLQGGTEGERWGGVGLGDRGGATGEEGAGGGLFICSAVLCPGVSERQRQLGGEKAARPGTLVVPLP